MDRNGKKRKAAPDPSLHPERSDTKAAARETLGRDSADARLLRERSTTNNASNARRKGGPR